MNLERLGSFHASRLSFTRTLVRRMHREKWHFEVTRNTLDDDGFGEVVYRIHTPMGKVNFIAFSTPLADSDRTDRVIAEKWDMCFTLFNGEATDEDVRRLSHQLPLQEAGRMSSREIVMSRANKSVRLFNSVVKSLAAGEQPEAKDIMEIGYLVRTTAVYGNGKFGLMDFNRVKLETPFRLPFQAEMLTVYMVRQFSFDLVEHIASRLNSLTSVRMATNLKRSIGVGNATGLGMAPFLVGHPQLISQWMKTRETAIAKVLRKSDVTKEKLTALHTLLERVDGHIGQWQTDDARQSKRIKVLAREIQSLRRKIAHTNLDNLRWLTIFNWVAEHTSFECQELLNSLLLEIYPEDINDFEHDMGVDEYSRLDFAMGVEQLREYIEKHYQWAIKIDFSHPDEQHYFWYVSQEKEEPRLGQRFAEPGEELEINVGVARDTHLLYRAVCDFRDHKGSRATVSQLLQEHPEHRSIVARIQSLVDFEYGEIQSNLLGLQCLPIDLLRCKLAIFGATRFDPKSNLWVRITLFQGAPVYDEIHAEDVDDWAFSTVPV